MIVTKSGSVLSVYNLSIAESAVFYTLSEDQDSDIKKISKSEILIIQKKDGTKINPEEMTGDTQNGTNQADNSTAKQVEKIGKPSPNNAVRIEKSRTNRVTDKNPDEKKKSNAMVIGFQYSENSILETEELELTIGSYTYTNYEKKIKLYEWTYRANTANGGCGPVLVPIFKNKTDKILYIDMGTSYYTVCNATTQIFYTASTKTTSSTSVTGGGLGIIGGAKANTVLSETAEQRIIAVPPHSVIKLENYYVSLCHEVFYNPMLCTPITNDIKDALEKDNPHKVKGKRYKGEIIDLEENIFAPIIMGFNYAMDESFQYSIGKIEVTLTPRNILCCILGGFTTGYRDIEENGLIPVCCYPYEVKLIPK